MYSKSQQITINVLVYVFSIMWTLRAYKILSYLSYRPRKHCQRGRFCVAKSESLEPNNLARSRTTANRSSPSLLYKEKRHNEGSLHFTSQVETILYFNYHDEQCELAQTFVYYEKFCLIPCYIACSLGLFQIANSCLLFNLFTH